MTRRQKDPLRPLTSEERRWLGRIARSHAEPASHVARAKALLAVADGKSYTRAAKEAGRRSGDAVSNLLSRFTIGRESAPSNPVTAVARRPSTRARNANESWPRRVEIPIAKRTARPSGRSRRCAGACATRRTGSALGEHPHHLEGNARSGLLLAKGPRLVRERQGRAQAQERRSGGGRGSRCGAQKKLIERA